MKKDKRETVGKVSSDLLQKEQTSQSPIELQRAMQEEYVDYLINCVQDHRKIFEGDFFVIVITKNEKLMPNVFRNYFFARTSCPTPEYDQTVFKYASAEEQIQYLWTIPSKDACIHLRDNALQVVPEERELLKFVLQFGDGTLYKLSKQLNGEIELETPKIIS
jgi:hypothetical protein